MSKRYASDKYAKPAPASVGQNAVNELVKDAIKSWKAKHECEMAALKVEIQEGKDSQQFISTKQRAEKNSEAKDSLTEDRHSRGQGQECSRPRTKDTAASVLQKQKKRSSKKFSRQSSIYRRSQNV